MAVINIYNTPDKYSIVYADPPWKQSRGGKKAVRKNRSGKPLDYQTESLEAIEEQ